MSDHEHDPSTHEHSVREGATRPENRARGPGWIESVLLLVPLRVLLGGAYAFAAYNKLGKVQSFADAIKGFKVVDADTHGHLIVTAAYTIPWVEAIAGVLLVVGLWARASALAIGLLTLAFIGGLLNVILSDISTSCSCFGDLSLVCPETVGWCQVIRNLILLVPAVYIVWRGGGKLGLDAVGGTRDLRL